MYPIGLAHDLGNSAAVIMTNLEYLDDVDLAAERDKMVTEILTAWRAFVERAQILARSNLHAAAADDLIHLRPTEVDLVALAREVAILSVGERRLALAAAPVHRSCDGVLMRSVFENLADNAARHMGADDVLTIRVEPASDGSVAIEWENTGSVIEPALVERIFEFGFTSRRDGLGVGLAVARLFVELHGGTMTAESHPDRARFRIHLQAAAG